MENKIVEIKEAKLVTIENFNELHFLPKQYHNHIVEEPFFKGRGEHSINSLENLCEQFKEYIHQQQVIKQELKKEIVKLSKTLDGISFS